MPRPGAHSWSGLPRRTGPGPCLQALHRTKQSRQPTAAGPARAARLPCRDRPADRRRAAGPAHPAAGAPPSRPQRPRVGCGHPSLQSQRAAAAFPFKSPTRYKKSGLGCRQCRAARQGCFPPPGHRRRYRGGRSRSWRIEIRRMADPRNRPGHRCGLNWCSRPGRSRRLSSAPKPYSPNGSPRPTCFTASCCPQRARGPLHFYARRPPV